MKRNLTYFATYIFIFLLITLSSRANEIKILYKIENEIITNYDIVTENNYLIALNNSLEKLPKNKFSSNHSVGAKNNQKKKNESKMTPA